MGDPVLAKLMRDMKVKAPVERIVRTDQWTTIHNKHKLDISRGERVVDLACGHQAITTNLKRYACQLCHEMILNGEDYDSFRNQRETAP